MNQLNTESKLSIFNQKSGYIITRSINLALFLIPLGMLLTYILKKTLYSYHDPYFGIFYAFLAFVELYLIIVWGLSFIFIKTKMNDYLKLFFLLLFFIIGMLPSLFFTVVALTGFFQ
ncbi:MAG: hypothetical protein ACPG5B_13615 [Chitinophagales bacterium]